jgi:hypothetical protein
MPSSAWLPWWTSPTAWKIGTKGFVSYEIKGDVAQQAHHERGSLKGIGSCNSRERRYKNQDARTSPTLF